MNRPCLTDEQLGAFADGEVPEAEAAAARAHLAACPACAERVEALRRLDDLVRQAAVPGVSDEEWARTWDVVAARTTARRAQVAQEPTAWAAVRRVLWSLRWAAAAAVVALAIGIWAHYGREARAPEGALQAEACVVELLEPAEGYVSVYTHSEAADLTVITVLPSIVEEPPPDAGPANSL